MSVVGETGGVSAGGGETDEVDAEMAAIAAQRAAGIRTVAAAVATFVVVAFIGEFTLAEPVRLGEFELHRGYAYLFAPLAALIVGVLVFLRFRPAGGSFLDDTSLVASEAGSPRDAEAEAAAGLASGRKAVQAKIAGVATMVVGTVLGYAGVDAWYTHRNEAPRENPWEYVPRLKVEIGEVLIILGVSAALAFVIHRVLAPAKVKVAVEKVELDADTGALYGDIQRKSRQATLAGIVGGVGGLLAGLAAFCGLVTFLEPRTAFDLRVLVGAALAGVLLGGGLRKLMLPDSMREEGPLDFAAPVRTLVIELGGAKLTLKKRWLSHRYVLRTAQGEAAEASTRRVKDAVGIDTRQVDVTVHVPDLALAALAGTLAVDAL